MKFKKILSLSVVTSLLLTSGCTLETSREIQADVVDSTEGQEIEGLKDGGYYVKHDSKLYKVSDPNKTFETGNVVNNPDSERIIYFTDKKVDGEYTNEDWDKIPTLYEGDSLIYYYTDVLSETYNFERFEDVGYTIGIYNLNETVSGRYSFELESDYINDSDANKVSVLPTESAIIDKVSQKELRKGNISNYGTIIGLKQDKLYPFEIYAGTVLNKINIKADTRILGSMQVYESNDYEFLSSNIVKVNIPEWFNSGYYMINGLGLFRYVVGSSYDESTNFNVPNEEGDGIIEESTEEMEFESTEMTDYENTGTNENEEQYEKLEIEDDETAEFEIKSDGDKRVTIISSEVQGDGDGGVPDIAATITDKNNNVYEMKPQEGKLMVEIPGAIKGNYKISFTERNNREIQYKIEDIKANENVDIPGHRNKILIVWRRQNCFLLFLLWHSKWEKNLTNRKVNMEEKAIEIKRFTAKNDIMLKQLEEKMMDKTAIEFTLLKNVRYAEIIDLIPDKEGKWKNPVRMYVTKHETRVGIQNLGRKAIEYLQIQKESMYLDILSVSVNLTDGN